MKCQARIEGPLNGLVAFRSLIHIVRLGRKHLTILVSGPNQ